MRSTERHILEFPVTKIRRLRERRMTPPGKLLRTLRTYLGFIHQWLRIHPELTLIMQLRPERQEIKVAKPLR